MLDAFIPSLIIAASTVVAFVAGRLVGWAAARARATRIACALVLLLSIGAALFFWFSPSSRYTLLLPAAFAAGFFMYGGRRMTPGVFDRD